MSKKHKIWDWLKMEAGTQYCVTLPLWAWVLAGAVILAVILLPWVL